MNIRSYSWGMFGGQDDQDWATKNQLKLSWANTIQSLARPE